MAHHSNANVSKSYENDENSVINISHCYDQEPSCSAGPSGKTQPSSSGSSFTSKTPNKQARATKKKTNGRTPKKSPGRNTTPGSKGQAFDDRFIPNRATSNFDVGHFKLNQDDSSSSSPSDTERGMAKNLQLENLGNVKILSYNSRPEVPRGHQNRLVELYSAHKTNFTNKHPTRYIPSVPERILDAPDIVNDYYLNLLDWHSNNTLAVALGCTLYLWNAGTGEIEQLFSIHESEYICSVGWMQQGFHLAVGSSTGSIQIYDCERKKCLRSMTTHTARVGAVDWNAYILSSGSRVGAIHNYDVRSQNYMVSNIEAHSQEVCGLKWSIDGRYLASGGNDNVVNIWPVTSGQLYPQNRPLYSFGDHCAAVKAIAWCPFQPNVLISGGGTSDRTIKFWNISTGLCMNTIETQSQVCALLWSTKYKEFVSGHGYAKNQVIIWKYPELSKVTELMGHQDRVLHLALSPDGTTVLSAGADETLRLWKCFVADKTEKPASKTKYTTGVLMKPGIR